ncbi:hypothetical protein PLESTB_001713000 [Pleodorina starrii]|uniref:Uncharacterized protein n=1 Tax=Pleodorina starrii TaxID=330485 RepID=A0A9W6BZK3_9CHLO|nr:hypothetical protein PLESTB_001713000 [Pleodorina starrii]
MIGPFFTMTATSLLELRSSWAQSLASINPVDEEKVALLLRLCSQTSSGGKSISSSSIRDAAANILSLIGFIDKSGGQRVDLVMPEVVRQLPLLASDWVQPCAHVEQLERLFEDVFTGLRRNVVSVALGGFTGIHGDTRCF